MVSLLSERCEVPSGEGSLRAGVACNIYAEIEQDKIANSFRRVSPPYPPTHPPRRQGESSPLCVLPTVLSQD